MTVRILVGDCRQRLLDLPDQSVHCAITSPPYFGLRDYGTDGQMGLEATPDDFVAALVEVFRGVWRVLRDDGTAWLNLGDSHAGGGGYSPCAPSNQVGSKSSTGAGRGGSKTKGKAIPIGLKSKDLIGIPWRVAFALQADGWYLRSDIIWHKPNPMPESVTDRPTKAHEYVFLLTKAARYFYDADSIREPALTADRPGERRSYPPGSSSSMDNGEHSVMKGPFAGLPLNPAGRNRRSVWTINTTPYKGAHFATFPVKLVEPCLFAGCPEKCCPVCGTGWRRVVEWGELSGEAVIQTTVRPAAEIKNLSATSALRTNGRTWREHIDHGFRPDCKCPPHEPIGGTVLDPFGGAGTVGLVAQRHERNAILIELNPAYAEMARDRLVNDAPMFADVTVDGNSLQPAGEVA